jgi:rubrerythrin
MFTYSNGLNQIAKQANWLEMNGNTRGSDRLRILLEEHNYCSECGATQAFNPAFYHHTGYWRCPVCDGPQMAAYTSKWVHLPSSCIV